MEPRELIERVLTQQWLTIDERHGFLAALSLDEFGVRFDDAQPSGSVAADGVSGSWTSYDGRLDSLVLEFPGRGFEQAERVAFDERFGTPDPQLGWVVGDTAIYADATGGWDSQGTLLVLSRVASTTAKADELNAPHRAEVAATTAAQLAALTRDWPAWRMRRSWLAEAGIDVAAPLEDVLPVAPLRRAEGAGIVLGHDGRLASLRLELDHGQFPDSFADELAAALAERLASPLGTGRVELRPRPGGTTVLAHDPAAEAARQTALAPHATVVDDLLAFVDLVRSVPWPAAAPAEWEDEMVQSTRRAEFLGRLGCTVRDHHVFSWDARPQYRGIWSEWDQLASLMIEVPDDEGAAALVAGGIAERLTHRFGAPDPKGRWEVGGLRVEFGALRRVWLSIGLSRALDAADDFERRRAAGELPD